MGFSPSTNYRRAVAAAWRCFLFLVFCDQYNHKGQNRKNDHDHLIISHTLTPFFCNPGAKSSPCRNLPAWIYCTRQQPTKQVGGMASDVLFLDVALPPLDHAAHMLCDLLQVVRFQKCNKVHCCGSPFVHRRPSNQIFDGDIIHHNLRDFHTQI